MVSMLAVTALVLAGCTSTDAGAEADAGLQVYHYSYPGSDLFVPGTQAGLGWLFQLHNPTDEAMQVQGCTFGVGPVRQGAAMANTSLTTSTDASRACGAAFTLGSGGSVAYLVQVFGVNGTARMQFLADGDAVWARTIGITVASGATIPVRSHVQTATVGVWTNGTSFYTNIPALLQDPAFPAGGNIDINASLEGAAPLRIYVYENQRTEQPPASRDTCHFTTISGYNALLRQQAAGLTSLRWLHPNEAYTVSGAEDHFLYGDALIFLNTIVSLDEVTDASFSAPEPEGACYDPQHTLDYYGIPVESPAVLAGR